LAIGYLSASAAVEETSMLGEASVPPCPITKNQ
jgi:hypothetical protein